MDDRINVWGTVISPMPREALLQKISDSIAQKQVRVVASQNLHGMYVNLHDAAFRSLHEETNTIVHVDGMPLVWLARLAGHPVSVNDRVTLVDLIHPLLARASDGGWRVFYLGGNESVLAEGLIAIKRQHPNLIISACPGVLPGGKTSLFASKLINQILEYRADLILVGLGMGLQESWIMHAKPYVRNGTFVTVGACIEYLAGAVSTPPRWMGRAGLEWLWRFAENPKRFWRRYLVEPVFVAADILKNVVTSRSRCSK